MAKTSYVDGVLLRADLNEWKKQCKKAGETLQLSEYTGECILKIATRLASKANFINYTFKAEMIGDAVECCVRYMHNYKPGPKANAFAYISQMCHNSFIRRIQTEEKHTYTKMKMVANKKFAVVTQPGDTREYRLDPLSHSDMDDPHIDVVVKYEEKLKRKKEKASALKLAKPKKAA